MKVIANGFVRLSGTLQIALLCIVALVTIIIALSAGSVSLSLHDIVTALVHPDQSLSAAVLWQLRIPRALNAFALGGLLALTGVYMQVLLRNPLADPFVVGTSGGAATGALIALLLGFGTVFVQGFAMIGAFAATLLVFTLAHAEGSWSPTRLLLTGVVVASGCGAAITMLLALGDESRLRGMVFWLMGDVSSDSPVALWLLLAVGGVLSAMLSRHLNLLSRGETQAQSLGLNTRRFRIGLFLISAILTASVVTRAGTIGFIGLIVPHLARQLSGSDHRHVVPVSILLGGSLLVLADTAARTLFAPRQLPVGAITALIGVPVFLTLMFAKRR